MERVDQQDKHAVQCGSTKAVSSTKSTGGARWKE